MDPAVNERRLRSVFGEFSSLAIIRDCSSAQESSNNSKFLLFDEVKQKSENFN